MQSVALTFDEAPDTTGPGTTAVLSILSEEQVPATFFICSNYLSNLSKDKKAQAMVKQMLAAGHDIGSHTATHIENSGPGEGLEAYSRSYIEREMVEVEEAVADLGITRRMTVGG
jgi:peptidoglycan/xylan/chitin deacetylase (PgdA/CDA1 family)